MKTWVVPVAVTLAYCHAAECPGGSCATPRASLLQLKSLSQKTETLATGSGSSTSAALAGFQKFTDEMIAKYGSDPNTVSANSTELEAVNIIYNFLDEMLSTFESSHADAKQKGDECYSFAYHTHCPFDWDTYTSFHEQWQTAQKDHYHCRRDAKVGCDEGPRHCDHYDAYRKFDQRAKMPKCIKDGIFGDAWFTDAKNDLMAEGHGSCNRDSQGNDLPGGWTQGNPLAQCDSEVRTWEASNAGKDGAKTHDVPNLLRDEQSVKWSEATYEESLAACRAEGFSTESGFFYDQCKTADSLVGDAWEKLKCGKQNPMAAGILAGTTPVNTHTWSQTALSAAWGEDCSSCLNMTEKINTWISGGFTATEIFPDNGEAPYDDPNFQSPSSKCRADWGPDAKVCNKLTKQNTDDGKYAQYKWDDSAPFNALKNYAASDLRITASTWMSGSPVWDGIDDDTAFIYTYGEVGSEEPWAHVDECRTTVEAEILKAGNTVNWNSDAKWNKMRGADYSAADPATKLLIKTALKRMTDKLTCGDNTFHDTATILASDVSTCVGGSSDCSQCECAKRESWKTFPAYCPEKTPRTSDYASSPLSGTCEYSGMVDLLETVYPFMEGTQCTAEGGLNPTGSGYYYVYPASGWHKLLKFEQCLDVTFDWLYGEKEVTEGEHKAYIDKFGASTVPTVQHRSGETLLQELYAEQIRRVGDDTAKYYAKLNGKWTGTSDARLGAFSASDVITTTKAYSEAVTACNSPGGSSMRWTRKPGWHKSELRYVAWMEPDGQRTSWGLWQHYVKCELAESHRAATLFADGQKSSNKGTFWAVETKETDSHTSGKSYWNRVGDNVRTSSSQSRTWNNASSSSHYSHTSLEAHKTISGRTHCVWIDGTCIDQWHIRCLDYYYMCAALQQRAEAAYLEWRFFRENECEAQEVCLTNGPDLACNAAYSAADDEKKKDSQMYKCSETCAIEHENAKAREADIETAERLRCMLEALFGKPASSATIEKGGAGAAEVGADCSDATCKDNLSCQNDVCVALDQVWTIPAGNERSEELAACNAKTYDLKYWKLEQEECPSWAANCAGVATRTYWDSEETDDEYKVWIVNSVQSSNTMDPNGRWKKDTGKWRKNCGTKLDDGAKGLCKTECTAKRTAYANHAGGSENSTEFWASWSTIYSECKDEHFLTTGLWNTHDVCHLTVFDHDNTKEQIELPRLRQAEDAETASSDPTYVESCYDSCSDADDDEYSVQSTRWGKFAFDFCDGGTLNLSLRNQKDSGISLGRKALHHLGWNNKAAKGSTHPADKIFSYAWQTTTSYEELKMWTMYSDSKADLTKDPVTRAVLCTHSETDESWTPNKECGALCKAYDGLTELSEADCWRERAINHVVDDEFGPAHCKISN